MSEQKDKYFHRQHNRFIKTVPRKILDQSIDIKNSFSLSQPKEQSIQNYSGNKSQIIIESKGPYNFTSNIQQNLKKWMTCTKINLQNFLTNKSLRQQLKRQQKRLNKIRNDNKLINQIDNQLSLNVFNIVLDSIQEFINQINKQKNIIKTTVRLNQQKEINRQLKIIDQQMEINNFASVKSTIQILLKKYGKDQLLQQKIGYLNYLLAFHQEYDRETLLLKDLVLYVERLSSVDITPDNINQSSLNLKNLKKQLNININKQNKKQQPNMRMIGLLNNVDKMVMNMGLWLQSKIQKKIQVKSKRQLQLQKQLLQKNKLIQSNEQLNRYCRQLYDRLQNGQQIFRQLQNIKKNKKKMQQSIYQLIIRLHDQIINYKKQINDINNYFKLYTQINLRKNINNQNILIQIKKLDQKYNNNLILNIFKNNLELLFNSILQRQRIGKETSIIQQELKRSKLQIQKLQKNIEQIKLKGNQSISIQKIDKRKQLQQKRIRDGQKLKQQKQQKQIDRIIDNILNNLSQKKWKITKNNINLFRKKYQQSNNPLVIKYIQIINIILNMIEDIQLSQSKINDIEKRQKSALLIFQKEKQILIEKNRSLEEYQSIIKILLENINQQNLLNKKIFDQIKKDRKKIIQQKYQNLIKFQQFLLKCKSKKQQQISDNKNISLSLSLSAVDNQLQKIKLEKQNIYKQLIKEKQRNTTLQSRIKELSRSNNNQQVQQLLNLVKIIQKGGQQWKFLPKNHKNSSLKPIYSLLQKYRQNQLAIQRYVINEQLFKGEDDSLNRIFDEATSLINKQAWFADQFWETVLSKYRGNKNCDKLVNCLRSITNKANMKLKQIKNFANQKSALETKNQELTHLLNEAKRKIDSFKQNSELETEIQRLTLVLSEAERKIDSFTQKSAKLEESSRKSSSELRNSRKTSRSKQKQAQVKDTIQQFVQQQKNLLSKIEQLSQAKQNLEVKLQSLENQLGEKQRKLQSQKVQHEKARYAIEKIRMQQFDRISILQGEIQIIQGDKMQIQTKLQNEIQLLKQIQQTLRQKLQIYQQKQLRYQQNLKQQELRITNEIQNRLTSQINYYKQIYGQISKDLQISKEKQSKAYRQIQNLQKQLHMIEVKYQHLSNARQQTKPKNTDQSIKYSSQQKLKMKPYKIDLNSSKIFDLYLDEDPVQPKKVVQQQNVIDLLQLLRIQNAQLKEQILKIQSNKIIQIERQIKNVIQNQTIQFNEFLKRFQIQKYQFFMTHILPQKIQQQIKNRNINYNLSINSEILHSQWIANQFPRLYQERHKRHCQYAAVDIDLLINNRAQSIIEDKKMIWQGETNEKIEQALFQYQQNTLPVFLQQYRLQLESQKAKQWQSKIWQIEQYWRKILDQQKNNIQSNQSVSLPVESSLNRNQILELVEKEQNKQIIDSIVQKQLMKWQETKSIQLAAQAKEIQQYWLNVIIPQRQQVWKSKIQQITIQKTQSINKQSRNIEIAIQDWKTHNLPTIIENERKFAIESFIQIDLPIVLEQERALWQTQQPNVEIILGLEYQKWQQAKKAEITYLNTNFDIRINEILNLQHMAWQKEKAIQIERIKISSEQIINKKIELVLQQEHQHWQLVKLQEIRRMELQFETRINETERKLNSQIIEYQQKYLRQQNQSAQIQILVINRWKNNELPLILIQQRQNWLSQFKLKQLPRLLDEKNQEWQSLINNIRMQKGVLQDKLSKISKQWQRQKQQILISHGSKISQVMKSYEQQLSNLGQQIYEIQNNNEFENKVRIILDEAHQEWEKEKQIQWAGRVAQIQNYWINIIVPGREQQWRKQQLVYIDQFVKIKIQQVEKTYHQQIIPNIIKSEQDKWQAQHAADKQKWINQIPNLLKSQKYYYLIQPFVENASNQYQVQLKKAQTQSANLNIRIEGLQHEIAQYNIKIKQYRNKYEIAENKINNLLSENQNSARRKIQQSQRINQELNRSRWAEKQTEDLRKIIQMQKADLLKLANIVQECERLRLQNLNLQQINSNIQKSKRQEINDIRIHYQTKILQISSEKNLLQAKITQFQAIVKQVSNKQSVQSLQRQISTLTATLKTKDTQILFLKKNIDNNNIQLRQNREKLNQQIDRRSNTQVLINQLKGIKLQQQYQIKYLKDRQQSLTKRLELKQQQMGNLRKKIELDQESLQKKLKSSIEYTNNYQQKYNQLQGFLSLKIKQYQSLSVDFDRIKAENQSLFITNQALTTEKQTLKRQVREIQLIKNQIELQKSRLNDDLHRTKLAITQKQDELRRLSETNNRASAHINGEKLRYENELRKIKEEYSELQIELKESQRFRFIETERANRLEREIAQNARDAQLNEIQVLKKINKDVSEITATNRQLEMKCILLQNRQKITNSTSETINSYLLIQKHTDSLVDYLLKEGIIPNLELYHKFVADSRVSLTEGNAIDYFKFWQKIIKDLFQLSLSSRAEEMRAQAQQLIRLRDEMTDVLQRQIEASQGDQTQLVEDYKTVLSDIKALVKQFVNSGDQEYLRLLCNSLGI